MLSLESLQQRADEVTEEYGIARIEIIWKDIHFDLKNPRIVRHLGTAHFLSSQISIRQSVHGVERSDEALWETLNHELAHFVAWHLTGDWKHGRGFKKYARKLGSFGRAAVGSIEYEKARDKKAKDAKALRAANRRAHAEGLDNHPEHNTLNCQVCRKDFWKGW